MAMKTEVRRAGQDVIIRVEGSLDFESTNQFRERLLAMEKQIPARRYIFDMQNLQFVGSSGISAFIQTLREFNQNTQGTPLYTNFRAEFRQIIDAFDDAHSFPFADRSSIDH